MALWIVAALLGLLTLVRLVVGLRTGTRLLLDHPSGAWATIADDLLHFRAVVLRRPAGDPHGVDWYSGKHFGPGFLEALRSGYLLAASHPTGPGPYWTHDVWRPRP